jgi:hypothetical protein
VQLIHTNEAAEKLGVSTHVIRNLIKYKVLNDYKRHNPHHRRHNPLLDKSEVNAVKAVYDGKRVTDRTAKKMKAVLKADKKYVASKHISTNGKEPHVETSSQMSTPSPMGFLSRVENFYLGIEIRLSAIEKAQEDIKQRLDTIVKLWS